MGVTKTTFFDSKETAATYIQKKNKVVKENIFFFETEKERNAFYKSNSRTNNLYYYGLAVNDSLLVDDSNIGDVSCAGIVDGFVLNYDKNTADYINYNLAGFTLNNYKGQALDLNKVNPTLIFMVSPNMGRTINVSANYITKNIEKAGKEINYVYIFIDPIIISNRS